MWIFRKVLVVQTLEEVNALTDWHRQDAKKSGPSNQSYLSPRCTRVREDIKTKKLFNSGIARMWGGGGLPLPEFFGHLFLTN